MFGWVSRPTRLPQNFVGLDLRRRYRSPLLSWVSAPHMLCLWTTSPGARALGMPFNSTTGLSNVHVLEEFMLEAGAIKGRDLRLEVAEFGRELLEIVMGMWVG